MRIIKPFAVLIFACAFPAVGKDKPLARVEQTVKEPTKRTVTWEQDMAAREESLAQARTLLRKPLTATTAVQVALLNNRARKFLPGYMTRATWR